MMNVVYIFTLCAKKKIDFLWLYTVDDDKFDLINEKSRF